MKILGIETSCDETSAGIIDVTTDGKITLLSNITATSLMLHAKTGGIIPEIAAREQVKYILPVIHEALKKAEVEPTQLDAIAATYGPGLIGSLLVGVETAKTLSILWNKPLIPVNHLFGHIYANFIQSDKPTPQVKDFPAIAVLISGAHTDLVLMSDIHTTTWLGGTRDDAAGEAFDKIGRMLGLAYPAGPDIERLAHSGNPKAYHFPRPLAYDNSFDFSFSGLKTAVLREVEKILSHSEQVQHFERDCPRMGEESRQKLDQQTIANICRCAQDAICDVIISKTLHAAEKYNAKSIIIGGGVSANQTLFVTFQERIAKENMDIKLFSPARNLSTDNGAMIAASGYFMNTPHPWQEITANPELYFD